MAAPSAGNDAKGYSTRPLMILQSKLDGKFFSFRWLDEVCIGLRLAIMEGRMPLEIEIKIALDSLSPLEHRLSELGATLLGRFLEVNIFLDRQNKTLRRTDQGLRVRVECERQPGAVKTVVMTHKGPHLSGIAKTREETELQVQDEMTALTFMGALGFYETLRFEKRRDRWQLDGCLVELDTLPWLGHFVEIEGPSEEAIQAVRQKLGLAGYPLESTGYAAMISREISQRDIHPAVVVFETNRLPQ